MVRQSSCKVDAYLNTRPILTATNSGLIRGVFVWIISDKCTSLLPVFNQHTACWTGAKHVTFCKSLFWKLYIRYPNTTEPFLTFTLNMLDVSFSNSVFLYTYLHKEQLIPEARVVFSWVFFLNRRNRQGFVYIVFSLLSNTDTAIDILTAKISSYISTTFSFKGFLEDEVLLSSPAFFSTWDIAASEKIDTASLIWI